MEELKDKYNLRFSNCNYIISVISFLFKRETKLNRKVKRNIDNEEYYKIINSYFNNENESNYLGNLLLNERLNEISKIDKKDKEAIEISEYLINGLVKFEPIKNKDKLEEFKKGLIEHIHCALYRIRNKQTISNDLLDVIKYTMPLMYAYTTKRLSYIEDKYNIEFNDVETSFIAMYLASIYEENKDNEKLRILVVCSYGLASSSILKNRIISKIPNIEIIGPIMIDDIKKVDNYDLILSTSPINIDDKPIVIINPLLNNDDVMNINNKIDEYSFKKRCESLIEVDDKKEIHKLKEYIKDDDIQIVDSLTTWQEAIRQASKPLLDKKLIEESYILEMINAVNKYGTYMVLSEGTAYVHAGKEDGIKENCTSLLVSKKPIKFGDTNTKLIYNIVVLGIKDDNSNMLNVVYILNNKNNIKKLKDKNISIEIIKELSN